MTEEKPQVKNNGPKGLGDPDDIKMKNIEKHVLIPSMIRKAIREHYCHKELEDLIDCSKDKLISGPIVCRDLKKIATDCMMSWHHKPEIQEHYTAFYLSERRQFRLTGVKNYNPTLPRLPQDVEKRLFENQ